MVRLSRIALFTACAWAAAFSQEPASPVFELASVKAASPTQNAIDFRVFPGARLRIVNQTLADTIQRAYGIKSFQMAGGPGWLDAERFNIEAKGAGEADQETVMAMLRALLADRFQLKAHHEVRQGNVFELIVAGNEPKLAPSTADTSYVRLYRNTPSDQPGVSYTIGAQKASMKEFTSYLTGTLRRPVLDKTGMPGEYDFSVTYAIEDHEEAGASIFTALQQQLKLKLRPAKGSIDMLIIDSVERPTDN